MQERTKSFYIVFAIAASLIVPAAIALRSVVHPAVLRATSDNPTPLGYTWSLALFIIPIGVLAWWFGCRPDLKFPRKAFWRTIAVLAPLGFALDLLFGNAFFIFANKAATLGCDEYWMAAYNVPDYKEAARDITRIVRFHFASAVIGVVLIASAILYRKFLSNTSEGFPWYFIYLICAALVPSAGFFCTAQRFINWRAFS